MKTAIVILALLLGFISYAQETPKDMAQVEGASTDVSKSLPPAQCKDKPMIIPLPTANGSTATVYCPKAGYIKIIEEKMLAVEQLGCLGAYLKDHFWNPTHLTLRFAATTRGCSPLDLELPLSTQCLVMNGPVKNPENLNVAPTSNCAEPPVVKVLHTKRGSNLTLFCPNQVSYDLVEHIRKSAEGLHCKGGYLKERTVKNGNITLHFSADGSLCSDQKLVLPASSNCVIG